MVAEKAYRPWDWPLDNIDTYGPCLILVRVVCSQEAVYSPDQPLEASAEGLGRITRPQRILFFSQVSQTGIHMGWNVIKAF